MVEERLGKEVIADGERNASRGWLPLKWSRRGDEASRLARGDAVNRGKRGVELAADCQIIDNIAKPTRSCGRCPREIDANRGTKPQVQIERGPIVQQQQRRQQQHYHHHDRQTFHTRFFRSINSLPASSLCTHTHICVYIYAYIHIYTYMYIIYMYFRSRERVIRYLTVSLRVRSRAR